MERERLLLSFRSALRQGLDSLVGHTGSPRLLEGRRRRVERAELPGDPALGLGEALRDRLLGVARHLEHRHRGGDLVARQVLSVEVVGQRQVLRILEGRSLVLQTGDALVLELLRPSGAVLGDVVALGDEQLDASPAALAAEAHRVFLAVDRRHPAGDPRRQALRGERLRHLRDARKRPRAGVRQVDGLRGLEIGESDHALDGRVDGGGRRVRHDRAFRLRELWAASLAKDTMRLAGICVKYLLSLFGVLRLSRRRTVAALSPKNAAASFFERAAVGTPRCAQKLVAGLSVSTHHVSDQNLSCYRVVCEDSIPIYFGCFSKSGHV